MAAPPPCRVCGSRDTRHLMTTTVSLTKRDRIEHCCCLSCGSVFVATPLDQSDLAEAYGSVAWDKYYEENYATNRNKFASGIRFLNKNAIPSDAEILDIGGGDGMFAELLSENGFTRVSIHEIPGASVKAKNVENIYQDFDYKSVPDARFDVVTMMDVFEHVPDPSALLTACHRILKPGGVIYFHTPAVTRMDRFMHVLLRLPVLSAVGKTWARGRTSVFHLENYTKEAFQRLFRDRFEVISMEFKNELSWPVARYVRNYLTRRLRLPDWSSNLLAPFVYPFIATDFFNPNKAVVYARRRPPTKPA